MESDLINPPAPSAKPAAVDGSGPSQIDLATYGLKRAWEANLHLGYVNKNGKTVLKDMSFKGPLRVQRPFYPEQGRCHSYVLHPPGGMVSGDKITIGVDLAKDAQALVTTPSAGKIYGADSANVVQRQFIRLSVEGGAVLEFLPQENILFNGANAELDTQVDVAQTGALLAWDIVSFGRPHGGYLFESGALQQRISIRIADEPVLIEAFKTDESLRILESDAGLQGHLHMGSFFVVVPERVSEYDGWLELVREHLPEATDSLKLAATHRRSVLVIRGLADDIETLRNIFIELWKRIRKDIIDAEPTVPRIWLT